MVSAKSLEELHSAVVERTIRRLGETYNDFFLNEPGFDRIPDFFRDHLYAPENKAGRDASLEQLYERLKSVTGADMTTNIYKLIQLIHLSDDLDHATAEQIISTYGHPPDPLSLPQKSIDRAIALSGRFKDRLIQVDLICETLSFFFTLARLPFSKLVMAPVRVAAALIGAGELARTMEQGYEISRGIRDMKPFVEAFTRREGEYLNRIHSEYGTLTNPGGP